MLRNLLRAQVLFHRHRVIRAAFDRRVIAHHHAVHATDPANAGNHASARRVVVVEIQGRQWRQLQKRRARVQQIEHPLPGQQLTAPRVLGPRRLAAALRYFF